MGSIIRNATSRSTRVAIRQFIQTKGKGGSQLSVSWRRAQSCFVSAGHTASRAEQSRHPRLQQSLRRALASEATVGSGPGSGNWEWFRALMPPRCPDCGAYDWSILGVGEAECNGCMYYMEHAPEAPDCPSCGLEGARYNSDPNEDGGHQFICDDGCGHSWSIDPEHLPLEVRVDNKGNIFVKDKTSQVTSLEAAEPGTRAFEILERKQKWQ